MVKMEKNKDVIYVNSIFGGLISSIGKDWKRRQVQDHFKKFGLVLTDEGDVSSTLESLAFCFCQHLSGRYEITSLKEALSPGSDFVATTNNTEQQWILFCIGLEQKRREIMQRREVQQGEIINEIGQLMDEFQWFHLDSESFNMVCIGKEATFQLLRKKNRDNAQPIKSFYLWQNKETELFSCIVCHHSLARGSQLYWPTLLMDLAREFRHFFFHQLESCLDDDVMEATMVSFKSDVENSGSSLQHFETLFNDWGLNDELKTKLNQDLAPYLDHQQNVNGIEIEVENAAEDLKEELLRSLADAGRDTCIQRSKKYAEASQKDVENKEEAKRQNRLLQLCIKEADEEVKELENELEETWAPRYQAESALQNKKANLKEAETKEQLLLKLRDESVARYQQDEKRINDKLAECQRNLEQLKAEKNRVQNEFLSMDWGVEEIQRQLDSTEQGANDIQRRINQVNESIAQLEEEKQQAESEIESIEIQLSETKDQQKAIKQYINSAEAMLQAQKEKIRRKKGKLAWDRFRLNLSDSLPFYEFAKKRGNHRLFDIKNVTELIRETIKEFNLSSVINQERCANLIFHIENNSRGARDEIRRILTGMATESQWNTTGHPWRATEGEAIILSDIRNKLSTSTKCCEEVHVYASRVIYIDCDWIMPGISFTLSAPLIKVVGEGKRTIDTSGRNATQHAKKKADDGSGVGVSGSHGAHGEAGQSAGHVTIKCDSLVGHLVVKANGGNGADGQDGGEGHAGLKGEKGRNGQLPSKMESYETYPLMSAAFVPVVGLLALPRRIASCTKKYFDSGTSGTAGKQGGNGGNSGCGGQGGFKGCVVCEYKNITGTVNKSNVDGQDGQDGTRGKGGEGGQGGENGLDVARVFEPDDRSPLMWATGNWRRNEGDLKIQPVYHSDFSDSVLGYRIERIRADKGRARDGQHGQHGQQANRQQRKTATPKKAMSAVSTNHWKTTSSTTTTSAAAVINLEREISSDATSVNNQEKEIKRKAKALADLQRQESEFNSLLATNRQVKVDKEEKMQVKESFIDELHLKWSETEFRREEEQKRHQEINAACEQAKQAAQRNERALAAKEAEFKTLSDRKAKCVVEGRTFSHKKNAELSQLAQDIKALRDKKKLALENLEALQKNQERVNNLVSRKMNDIENWMAKTDENKYCMREAEKNRLMSEEKQKNLDEITRRMQAELKLTRRHKVKKTLTERTQRIAEKTTDQFDAEKKEEDDLIVLFPYENNHCSVAPVDGQLPLKGPRLLDNLIAKFSDDIEIAQTVSLLAQSLVLQIREPNLWDSVTAIILNFKEDAKGLIQCLKNINKDIELAQFLLKNQKLHLVDHLQQAVCRKKQHNKLYAGRPVPAGRVTLGLRPAGTGRPAILYTARSASGRLAE